MDGWQKLEVASKVVAAVMIPLAVAYLGNQVATANKQRESETKFVELATTILTKEPGTNQSADSKNLRRWAVAVIDRFSGVPMPKETAEALVQSTALPAVASATPSQPPTVDPAGTWVSSLAVIHRWKPLSMKPPRRLSAWALDPARSSVELVRSEALWSMCLGPRPRTG